MKLTTKERVKARLSIESLGFDDLFDRLIESASAYIATLTSRDIESATFTEYYDCRSQIITRNAPITAITSVKIDNGVFGTPNFQTTPYIAKESLGVIHLNAQTSNPNGVEIVYTAGYVIDFANDQNHTLPVDLTELCERMVMRLFNRRETEGRTSETFEESVVTWGEIIDRTDERVLKAYSRLYQTT